MIDHLTEQEARRRGIPTVGTPNSDRTTSTADNTKLDAEAMARVASGYENAYKKRNSLNGRKQARSDVRITRKADHQPPEQYDGISRLGTVRSAVDSFHF